MQGVNLTLGLAQKDYTVFVGNSIWSNMQVTSNSITCRPPASQPEDPTVKVSNAVFLQEGYNENAAATPCQGLATRFCQVVVGTGCLTFIPFVLKYGGPFGCQPLLYTTVGCIAGVLAIVVVVIAICYKRKKTIPNPPGEGMTVIKIPWSYPEMPNVSNIDFRNCFLVFT